MNLKPLFLAGALATAPALASAATIAYEVPTNTAGNQSYTQILGMDFVVNQAINILSLGAFDDFNGGAHGISAGTTLTTEIWSRAGNTGLAMLASLSFTAADSGLLVGSTRFHLLDQILTLLPGEYTVVSYGYNGNDRNGNDGSWPGAAPWFTNDGGGLLSFVGGSRYGGVGGSGIGITGDGGPEDRYAAGSFTFESAAAVPLPASLGLLLGGLGFLTVLRRRRGA